MLHRLGHAVGEVALSFLFAGGVLLMSIKLMCRNNHSCNDFGGVAYLVAGCLVAAIAWGTYVSQCTRLRHRVRARLKLDIAVGIVTAALWAAILIME